MKTTLSILLMTFLLGICSAQTGGHEFGALSINNRKVNADTSLFDFYCRYSSFTDPGEYRYLYEKLPDSLPELCSLIKSQFIHPYEELPKYREQFPKDRWDESFKYPSVKSILKGLLFYDSRGLVEDREITSRLVLTCREYSILLASILKYHCTPARVRYGHATYIIPNFHTSHVVCEVWNENDKRWMLVDASTGMIDFSREKFDFSNEAWLKMQNREIDPNLFGIPRRYTGSVSIVAKVCTDLASILGTEFTIYQYAPILDYIFEGDKQLPIEIIQTLNKISELMKSIDIDNISKLQGIYYSTPEIQITKSFD